MLSGLAQGVTRIETITVIAPDNALATEPAATIFVECDVVESNENGTIASRQLLATVEQVYNISLGIDQASKKVDINDSVVFIIDVNNDGNGVDVIELQLRGPSGTVPWGEFDDGVTQGTTIYVTVPANSTVPVTFTVTIPNRDDWFAQCDCQSILYTINATSQGDSTKDFQLTARVDIQPIYELEVRDPNPTQRSGVPGDTGLSFILDLVNRGAAQGAGGDTFRIRNLGNDLDDFKLTFFKPPGSGTGSFEVGVVTLEADEVITVNFTFKIDINHDTTDFSITLQALSSPFAAVGS